MQLTFIPVENFYFAITLAMRTLEDIDREGLSIQLRDKLAEKFGQSSTIAAASQNTYNYVFRVEGVDNSPSNQLILSVADWQGKVRISSDYGWTLDNDRKPIRTEKNSQRSAFSQQVRNHLTEWLGVDLN
jgi:hypothetical protein